MRRDAPEAEQLARPRPLPASAHDVIEALAPLIGEDRLARIEAVLRQRTRSVVVVLEAVDDPRNVSAVLRSADVFGVQEVHLVRGEHPFLASKLVSQGADRWLDVIEHADAAGAVAALHARGFAVYAATMDGGVTPAELAAIDAVAVVFGNEQRGASHELLAACDGRCTIPMRGFSQSLNVSVAAAITMHAATAGRRSELRDEEQQALRARYMWLSVPRADEVVREHLERRRR
jgi:tRNA (guanosine-2'-O-)-methyltransferase